MAGKRQHYIPRMLQRGFLADEATEGERTWLHRRNGEARLVGIRDIGVEDWFYSRKTLNGRLSLDDVITEFENDIAPIIGSLRDRLPGSICDAQEVAGVVAHLITRTAHLRRIFTEGMASVVNEVANLFTDPARLGAALGVSRSAVGSTIEEAIRASTVEFEAAGIPAALSQRLCIFILRENSQEFLEKTSDLFGPVVPELHRHLISKVREWHNNVFENLEWKQWIYALSLLCWTVEVGEDLILPDAVALAAEKDGPLKPVFFSKANDIDMIALPICQNKILIGRRTIDRAFCAKDFNKQAASSSKDFFISSKKLEDFEFCRMIGTLIEDEIISLISSGLNDFRIDNSADRRRKNFIEAIHSQKSSEYVVLFIDIEDKYLQQSIENIIDVIVKAFGSRFPMQDLDGFTIAADYHRAIEEIDRGDPKLPRLSSGALGYGQGIAMPITVVRGNVSRQHLVIQSHLAQSWLSSDNDIRAVGLHTIVKMLAGIAHTSQYNDIKNFKLRDDIMVQQLHSSIAHAPSNYWSARQAAMIHADYGEIYADLILQSLDFAETEIAQLRSGICDDFDYNINMRRALNCIRSVLGHAAEWLGHRDGLYNLKSFKGNDLPQRIKHKKLQNWIELFGHDLSICYDMNDRLYLDRVMSLSVHSERLLWHAGIYCWPDNNAMRYIMTDRCFESIF